MFISTGRLIRFDCKSLIEIENMCFFLFDRLVSERSIEENILKKANQKRLLGDLAIEGGNFTTAFFKKSTVRDLFDVENKAEDNDVPTEIIKEITSENTEGKSDRKAVKAFEKAIASVEDNTDLEVKFHQFLFSLLAC